MIVLGDSNNLISRFLMKPAMWPFPCELLYSVSRHYSTYIDTREKFLHPSKFQPYFRIAFLLKFSICQSYAFYIIWNNTLIGNGGKISVKENIKQTYVVNFTLGNNTVSKALISSSDYSNAFPYFQTHS